MMTDMKGVADRPAITMTTDFIQSLLFGGTQLRDLAMRIYVDSAKLTVQPIHPSVTYTNTIFFLDASISNS